MPERRYQFLQLDVFTQRKLEGNPLAIFPEAEGLSDREMQSLAREMNLSETTYVFPRPPEVEAREGVKVRIFTTEEELPFAGHPTLGTALALHSLGRGAEQEIVLDLKVGRIPVRFQKQNASARPERADGSLFGEMRQRDPEFGPLLKREEAAHAIGIAPEALAEEWPAQVVSTGVAFAVAPFRDVATLAGLQFTFAPAAAYLKAIGVHFFYFICPERRDGKLEVRARMIFYNGEDPATGSAAGCAAAWMAQHKVAQSGEPVLIRQGVEAGRPSSIHVRASNHDGKVSDVRVGGYAIEVLRGEVAL